MSPASDDRDDPGAGVNRTLAMPDDPQAREFSPEPEIAMQLSRQDAEREVIRRWYLLPPFQRQTYEDAEAYAARLVQELEFYTVTSRQRLIAAWMIRELQRTREAEDVAA
jgi:hypothetical protein